MNLFVLLLLLVCTWTVHAAPFAVNWWLTPHRERFLRGDTVTIKWSITDDSAECHVTNDSPVEVVVFDADSVEYFDNFHTIASAVDPSNPVTSISTLKAGAGEFTYTFPDTFKDCNCGKDLYFKVRLRAKPECASGRAALWEFDSSSRALVFGSNTAAEVSAGQTLSMSLRAVNLQGITIYLRLYETRLGADMLLSSRFIYINGVNERSFAPSSADRTVTVHFKPTLDWDRSYDDLYIYASTSSEFNDANAEAYSDTFNYNYETFRVMVTEPRRGHRLRQGDDLRIRWTVDSANAVVTNTDTFRVFLYDLHWVNEIIAERSADSVRPKILDGQVTIKASEIGAFDVIGYDLLQVKLVHNEHPNLEFWSETFNSGYSASYWNERREGEETAGDSDESFVGTGAFYGVVVTAIVCCLIIAAVLIGLALVCAQKARAVPLQNEMTPTHRHSYRDSRLRGSQVARAGVNRVRESRRESRARVSGMHRESRVRVSSAYRSAMK